VLACTPPVRPSPCDWGWAAAGSRRLLATLDVDVVPIGGTPTLLDLRPAQSISTSVS
jgi:hypothetical protein